MDQLVLVNKQHPLKENYFRGVEMVETKDMDDGTVRVEKETFQHFLELQKFCKEKGIDIVISSAYRSLSDQQAIYDYYLEKEGEEYCEKYVAPLGCSEHHTGLAIDFYVKEEEKEEYPEADDEINTYEKYEQIHPFLKDFGFILRYPKGKEEITGYAYEPWHIRYVGKLVANLIDEQKYTLEEYKEHFSGVLVINKEKNMTSFDVVEEVSRLLGIKKVGHTGTLDPMAEGVLIVCFGEATKIGELITAYDKEYIAEAKLGMETDTYDTEGRVMKETEVPENLPIESVISSFQKTYLQEVPIYSAVKVNGKKLYEYAREGKPVELPKKEVTIQEIELLSHTKDTIKFRAKVTKGCYIRSLIHDIGKELGIGATMTSLVRTKQGNVSIEEANTLEDLKQGICHINSIEDVLPFPKIEVDTDLEFKIRNGVKLENTWNIKDKVLWKNQEGKLLGIYEVKEKQLRVWKNFHN